MANTVHYNRLIFDNGADTSVSGRGWEIDSYYGPKINLVGFDSQWAKKKDLSICTADTILEHPHHGKLLIRIHKAVHNPSAQDTLLLEYQLSEKGCMIDSKPPHHQYPNGTFGTQSFPYPRPTSHLEIRHYFLSCNSSTQSPYT